MYVSNNNNETSKLGNNNKNSSLFEKIYQENNKMIPSYRNHEKTKIHDSIQQNNQQSKSNSNKSSKQKFNPLSFKNNSSNDSNKMENKKYAKNCFTNDFSPQSKVTVEKKARSNLKRAPPDNSHYQPSDLKSCFRKGYNNYNKKPSEDLSPTKNHFKRAMRKVDYKAKYMESPKAKANTSNYYKDTFNQLEKENHKKSVSKHKNGFTEVVDNIKHVSNFYSKHEYIPTSKLINTPIKRENISEFTK